MNDEVMKRVSEIGSSSDLARVSVGPSGGVSRVPASGLGTILVAGMWRSAETSAGRTPSPGAILESGVDHTMATAGESSAADRSTAAGASSAADLSRRNAATGAFMTDEGE